MRVLFWYCQRFNWVPTLQSLEGSIPAHPATNENAVVAFIHVEPQDVQENHAAETKLVKNAKWLARKWSTQRIILLERVDKRLQNAGYTVVQTPYGYFNDLVIEAPGHPLARIYKAF